MLTICSDILPQSCLSYLAFRLACMETLKLIEISRQLPAESEEPFGFLTEVPFLREVAPRVQIAHLAETWRKHRSEESFEADLVDESVVYAICETAAAITEEMPELVLPYIEKGPRRVELAIDDSLAGQLRGLHLQLSNEGDFLFISQLQDLPPDESQEFKEQFGLHEEYLQPMFDVLARWHVPDNIGPKLRGLLTDREIRKLLPLAGFGGTRLGASS